MRQVVNRVREFLRREDGPTSVEYAVMLALIVVVCVVTIAALGVNANKAYTKAANAARPAGS